MNRQEIKLFHESSKDLERWITEIKSSWANPPKFNFGTEKIKHLAIICDGNRRAAERRRLNASFGHQAGVETIKGIARTSREWGIHTISFWVWSTENWLRPPAQVEYIMDLAIKNFTSLSFLEELKEKQVRFTHIGRKDRLSNSIRLAIENLEKQTEKFTVFRLNLGLDYGGLDETARGILKMFDSFQKGEFNPQILRENPQKILDFLDTANQPEPDLIIRTGMTKKEIFRTSGFMSSQSAYTGWVFLPDFFPNLTPKSLLNPIKEFQEYQRRFGK